MKLHFLCDRDVVAQKQRYITESILCKGPNALQASWLGLSGGQDPVYEAKLELVLDWWQMS